MKVMADERRRITLPQVVHPGDVFEIESQGSNCFVLTKLQKPGRPLAKMVKRGELLLLTSEEQITWEETRAALDEFP